MYNILLDIATLGYLLFYLPQVWRNRCKKNLLSMNLGWHALLLMGACCDVFYGFGVIHQWQYRFVACVMLALLVVQQGQLSILTWSMPERRWPVFFVAVFAGLLMLSFLLIWHYGLSHTHLFFTVGWIERLCYWGYSVPQIMSQWKRPEKTQAIAPISVWIALITGLIDAACAWHFHWGPSSRYGTPLALLLHGVVLYQCCSFRFQAKPTCFSGL